MFFKEGPQSLVKKEDSLVKKEDSMVELQGKQTQRMRDRDGEAALG